MVVRTKKYELKVGEKRQVKVIDNTAPIKIYFVGAAADINHKIEDLVIGTSPAFNADGDLAFPSGSSFGSEVELVCTTAGTIYVSYMG